MASTTKIMTAIVAIERCNMDEIVDVECDGGKSRGARRHTYLREINTI